MWQAARVVRSSRSGAAWAGLLALSALGLGACAEPDGAPPLARVATDRLPPPDVPVPPADGPPLLVLGDFAKVLDRPSRQGRPIGFLRAGARVPRGERAFPAEGCRRGYYAVRPRGFVCADDHGATTDPAHPALGSLPLAADLDAALPFAYARTLRDTPLFEGSGGRTVMVNQSGVVPGQSGMAVVGSLGARDGARGDRRLALMTNGRFVDAVDLERARSSEFRGIELTEGGVELPVGFVVKPGVVTWRLEGQKKAHRDASLGFHERLDLTGRFRTVRGVKFWALGDGRWIRHGDVTLVRRRAAFPDFVRDETRWIDVSVVTGTLALYEGKRPVFATLVSVGADSRAGDDAERATRRGQFKVVFKHVTGVELPPASFAQRVDIYDLPWALELSSGQFIHGTYWHDRFGVEHGPGNLQLSPADARRVFLFATPRTPNQWHAVAAVRDEEPTIVWVR